MNNDERDFEWGEVITKPVYTSDNKHVGHVDGLEAGHCATSLRMSKESSNI